MARTLPAGRANLTPNSEQYISDNNLSLEPPPQKTMSSSDEDDPLGNWSNGRWVISNQQPYEGAVEPGGIVVENLQRAKRALMDTLNGTTTDEERALRKMQLDLVLGLIATDPRVGAMEVLAGDKEDVVNLFTEDPMEALQKIVFCPDCHERDPSRFVMSFDAWVGLRSRHVVLLQQCPGRGCKRIFYDLEVKFNALRNLPSRLACARVDHHVPARLCGVGGVVGEHTPMACNVAWKNNIPVDPVDPDRGDLFLFENFDNLEYRLTLSNLERNAFHFRTLEEMLAYGQRWGGLLAHYGMSPTASQELFSQHADECNIATTLLVGGGRERTNRLQNNIRPFHTKHAFKYRFGRVLENRNLEALQKTVKDPKRFGELVVSAYKVGKGRQFRPFQCRVGDASTVSIAKEDNESDAPLTIYIDNIDLRIVRQRASPKRLFVEYKKATSTRWHKCAPLTPIVFEMGEQTFVFVQPNGNVPKRFYLSSSE